MKRFHASLAPGLMALMLAAAPLQAQLAKTPPPEGAESITAPIAGRYENAGLARWFLGAGYRSLWAVPIEIPVLDLGAARGGLTPTETGGYGQTFTLEFLGGDGLEYAVRSIDKDPTRRLDSLFMGTVVARLVQDQVGQFLPTAGLIVDPLLEATGILYPRHELVVIPDDPRLGEFREDHAGLIGLLTDRPQEGANNTPGFAGSRRVSRSDNFLEELEEGACNRADARGYLKARLMDMVIGDRDRHEGQFRWARFPEGDGCYVWRVIPLDRDQAFIMNDGALMSLFRLVQPRQVRFGPNFPSLVGLTFNGWELDRQILVELDEPVWREVAEEIERQLTDEVIEGAVHRLPGPHYALRGTFLETALKSRRDQLVEEALDFYRLISGQAEIKATDRAEHAVFEHLEGGDLRVTISYLDGPRSDGPYFGRTFRHEVTSEVRLRLQGGDDFAEVRGADGRIKVRVIGGGGDDRYSNTSRAGGGNTRFYDDRGDNEFEGRARVDRRSFRRPPSTNLVHRYALDWGGVNRYIPQLGYSPDLGLTVGLMAGFQRYGFRKVPWQSDNTFLGGITSNDAEFFFGWNGRYRNVIGGADLVFEAEYSGINILRFHGFGNETSVAGVDDVSEFFEVEQGELILAPGLEWSWGGLDRGEQDVDVQAFRPEITFGVGPSLKYANTSMDANEDKFIATLDPAPVGIGGFGQLGGRAWFSIDTRDRPGYPTRGLYFLSGVSAFPAILDADDAFGETHGSLSVYLTPGESRRAPTLALRAGGQQVFGTEPFHESAFLGGRRELRGFREQRFAGDAAAFGNAELRLPLTQFYLLFPAEFGILGAADVGRVFFDGDPDGADAWHSGFGGGIWLSFLNRSQILSATVVNGDDLTALYIKAGLHF